MRYCLIAVTLFVVLPLMDVLAAPAPDPYAILDIGPPPRGETVEKHLQSAIGHLTFTKGGMLTHVCLDPEVNKLPSVAVLEDPRPWLSKNLQINLVPGTSRLRLTFRAGNRTEKVAILNSLLRVYVRVNGEYRQWQEGNLRKEEEGLPQLVKLVEAPPDFRQVECNRKELKNLQADIPKRRALIACYKQIAVISWAK